MENLYSVEKVSDGMDLLPKLFNLKLILVAHIVRFVIVNDWSYNKSPNMHLKFAVCSHASDT